MNRRKFVTATAASALAARVVARSAFAHEPAHAAERTFATPAEAMKGARKPVLHLRHPRWHTGQAARHSGHYRQRSQVENLLDPAKPRLAGRLYQK